MVFRRLALAFAILLVLRNGREDVLAKPTDLQEKWNFPQTRRVARLEEEDPKPRYGVDAWIMPPSRDELDEDEITENEDGSFIKLPTRLRNVSSSIQTRFQNVSQEFQDKMQVIQEKLVDDVKTAVLGGKNQTIEEHFVTTPAPSYFASINLVKSFFNQIAATLGLSDVVVNPAKESERSPRALDLTRTQKASSDIQLPSWGFAGELVNEIAKTAINAATIWHYQDAHPNCYKKLLCESNQQVFGRGYLVPSLITYGTSLVMSFLAPSGRISDNLIAAQKGRHGEDCEFHYPGCEIQL